jgi:hypothetical protein
LVGKTWLAVRHQRHISLSQAIHGFGAFFRMRQLIAAHDFHAFVDALIQKLLSRACVIKAQQPARIGRPDVGRKV